MGLAFNRALSDRIARCGFGKGSENVGLLGKFDARSLAQQSVVRGAVIKQ